jgi:hypothetical protein
VLRYSSGFTFRGAIQPELARRHFYRKRVLQTGGSGGRVPRPTEVWRAHVSNSLRSEAALAGVLRSRDITWQEMPRPTHGRVQNDSFIQTEVAPCIQAQIARGRSFQFAFSLPSASRSTVKSLTSRALR